MTRLLPLFLSSLFLIPALGLAQPPQRPLQAFDTWMLPGYQAADPEEVLQLPPGMAYERVSSVTFTPEGNLLILHRGSSPLLEFDNKGRFLRAFGDELELVMAHGLDVDRAGNIWVTDLIGNVVLKLDAQGKLLMQLGVRGEAGSWDDASAGRFHQPNETALDSAGNLYVVQGHLSAEPRVLKFSPAGDFLSQWGARGSGPGEFAAAHSIKIDADDKLYIADRENQRIQIFDTEGRFLKEWSYNAMVCSLFLHEDGSLYMSSGFDGEVAKVNMEDGSLVGALGSPGPGRGQFGEAHFLAVDGEENIFVADVVNRRVQVFERH